MLAGYLVFPSIWTIMVIVIFSTLLCFFKTNFCCSFFRITLNNFLLNLHFLYLVWILCSRISKSLYCGRVNFVYLFFQILFQSLSTHSILVSMECLLKRLEKYYLESFLSCRENVSYSIMLHGD